MSRTTTVVVWVLVDDEGNHVASHDAAQLLELYGQDYDAELAAGLRRVKVTLTVPLPVVLEVTGAAAGDGPATLVGAE